jgi:phospholipid/cholesterol/gamma-HCH transport system substrate-binding protein
VLVGILATVALILGLLGALWLARGGLYPGYPLFVKFTWGAGLRQGQPVLLSGVTVGNVDNVVLRPDGMLIVRLRIRRNFQVPRGSTAAVEPSGFFGDQLVSLRPGAPTPTYFAPGDTVPTGRGTPSVGEVLTRLDTLAAHFNVLAGAFTRELVDRKGLEDLHRSVVEANRMFDQLSRVTAEQSAELTRTQGALRRAAGAVDSAKIDSTLRSLRDAAASVRTFVTDLRATSVRLDSLIAKASSGPGTVGRALNDPALYADLQSAIRRLDSLMTDFQKNPRKYIRLSIF